MVVHTHRRYSFGCMVEFAVVHCSESGDPDERQLVERLKVVRPVAVGAAADSVFVV